MTADLMRLPRCAALSGLRPNEMMLGAIPAKKHSQLLASYRLNLDRGHKFVCGMIVADIRASLDIGATRYAADLLIVLRRFLSMRDEGGVRRRGREPLAKGRRIDGLRKAQALEAHARSRLIESATRFEQNRSTARDIASRYGGNIVVLDHYR